MTRPLAQSGAAVTVLSDYRSTRATGAASSSPLVGISDAPPDMLKRARTINELAVALGVDLRLVMAVAALPAEGPR